MQCVDAIFFDKIGQFQNFTPFRQSHWTIMFLMQYKLYIARCASNSFRFVFNTKMSLTPIVWLFWHDDAFCAWKSRHVAVCSLYRLIERKNGAFSVTRDIVSSCREHRRLSTSFTRYSNAVQCRIKTSTQKTSARR